MRRGARLGAALAGLLVLGLASVGAGAGQSGGPVVIMGIDAENGGVGGHGPISVYQDVVDSVLGQVTNGGSGILVLGGGKSPTDNVTEFWDEIGTGTSQTITYANSAAVGTQSFAGFAIVAVISSDTFVSGGLTEAESTLLAARSDDFSSHVNAGGGLIVFSQTGLTTAYGFLGAIGAFTVTTGLFYSDIDPTPEGLAVGITDALDLCCWHDTYETFPDFLSVLAFEAGTQNVAALGGEAVFIGEPEPEPEPAPASAPEPAPAPAPAPVTQPSVVTFAG